MEKLFDLSEAEMAAEFGDPIPESGLFTTTDQNVSGIGVENGEADEEADEEAAKALDELLNSLNSGENADIKDEMEREAAQREEYERAEEARIAEIERRYNEERYAKEQAAKAKRLEEQRAKEEVEEAEERARKEKTVFGKLSKMMKKPAKAGEPVVAEEPKEITAVEEEVVAVEETALVSAETAVDESYMEDGSIEGESHLKEEPVVIAEEKPVKIAKEKPVKEKPVKERKPLFAGFSLPKPAMKTSPVKAKEVVATASEEPDWKYIAQHDEMTGMLNTRAYKEALGKMPLNGAVVFFDVNNLKYINDNFSHSAGNKAITTVAEQIVKAFGEENAFRIGGDEFVAFVPKIGKNGMDKLSKITGEIHGELSSISKTDAEKIPYSVSVGYAIGDGKRAIEDVVKAADTAMYRNKKAYKDSHPQYNARGENKAKEQPKPAKQLDHDALLTADQRDLKQRIIDGHKVVSNMSTNQVVREIQKRASEIRAVFIASPTFDHLFIIRDVNDFINIVLEQNAIIDYSYLYVVYEGGPCYYGAQEYYTEVTHIFENITEGLLSGKFKSVKDIQSIKGINIFRNIYV